MLAKHNDKIHSEWARVCTADCDDELLVARVEIHAINHEVVARITVHCVHGIAGIVEASPELPLKARLVPKQRVIHMVEVHDLVADKYSRRTGYGILAPEYQPLNHFLRILADAWSWHDVVLVGGPDVCVS